MKHAVLLQAFDRRDPLAFLHRRKRHTRQDAPAIDVHGACATLSAIACLFGAGSASNSTPQTGNSLRKVDAGSNKYSGRVGNQAAAATSCVITFNGGGFAAT